MNPDNREELSVGVVNNKKQVDRLTETLQSIETVSLQVAQNEFERQLLIFAKDDAEKNLEDGINAYESPEDAYDSPEDVRVLV